MGYLTAVEEYFARLNGVPFDVDTLMVAARRLEPLCYEATRHAREGNFVMRFEDAVRVVSGRPAQGATAT